MATEKRETGPTHLSPNGTTVLTRKEPSPNKFKKVLKPLADHSSPEIRKIYDEVLTKIQS